MALLGRIDQDNQTLSVVGSNLVLSNGSGADSTVPLSSLGGGGGFENFVNDGEVIGDTLVLTLADLSTVNIPLIGGGSTIDFSLLTPAQVTALSTSLRGNLLCDLNNNPTGYLLEI